jgi:hypothetical protein
MIRPVKLGGGISSTTYRIIQEERSVFLEVTAAVIVKKVHMNMCFTEWLSKERCLNLHIKLHNNSFVELDEKRRLENKGG